MSTHIQLWYGKQQRIGHLGVPQRWVNVLGRVTDPNAHLEYTLNGRPASQLTVGPDRRRLANPGDFNVELDFDSLQDGANTLTLIATDTDGNRVQENVTLHCTKGRTWPLPCTLDWQKADAIQDVAQVVDGLWQRTPDGIRVLEPYYDRVLALGDRTWTDYEIATTVTFHDMRVPDKAKGDGGANVIHAALAVRWPGHDEDGNQPRTRWYPLGATAEFRVHPNWDACSWRILGGGKMEVASQNARTITPGIPYGMKHRVETRPNKNTQYSVKLWDTRNAEPETWDLQMEKGPDSVQAGGALLIAHYTVVTFGNVTAIPLV